MPCRCGAKTARPQAGRLTSTSSPECCIRKGLVRWHLIVWSEHAGSCKKISMENSPLSSVDSTKLRESMARRLYRRSVVAGEITLPAVPGMIDEYVKMCDTTFAAVGCPFTAEQLQHLRSVLEQQLAEAYAASQRSNSRHLVHLSHRDDAELTTSARNG